MAGRWWRSPRCWARTRQGTPCKAKALKNGRCRNHGGLSTGPRSEAGRAKVTKATREGMLRKNRPELEKAIDELGTGDILVVAEWDRATRSMFDGIHLIERINARGALIKVLDKPHQDLTTPLGRGFIAFLSAMAEDERQRIVKRATTGARLPGQRASGSGANPNSPNTNRPRPSNPARSAGPWGPPRHDRLAGRVG